MPEKTLSLAANRRKADCRKRNEECRLWQSERQSMPKEMSMGCTLQKWRPYGQRQWFEWRSTLLLCMTMYVQHWHRVRPNFPIFNEITRHTMILPNDNALRVHFSLAEKMTTMKSDGACYVVNDRMQVQQQKNNNRWWNKGWQFNASPSCWWAVHHQVRQLLWKMTMAGAKARTWMI